jgi:hypothetical protein
MIRVSRPDRLAPVPEPPLGLLTEQGQRLLMAHRWSLMSRRYLQPRPDCSTAEEQSEDLTLAQPEPQCPDHYWLASGAGGGVGRDVLWRSV